MRKVPFRIWMQPVMDCERALWRDRVSVAAGIAVVLWGLWIWAGARQTGRPVPASGFGWMALGALSIVAARRWASRREGDALAVGRRVEALFPELDGRLLTALEPVRDARDRLEGYLRHRLEAEVQAHLRRHCWPESYRRRERFWWGLGRTVTSTALGLVTVLLVSVNAPRAREGGAGRVAAAAVQVKPGDTEVERGAKLLVEARFPAGAPREVALEWLDASGQEVRHRTEMRRSLDDPVFGALEPRVLEESRYRVVYSSVNGGGSGASPAYAVRVYVLPELERADVTVRPPDYTGEAERVYRDVRRVSALEGSTLALRLQVNKPVAQAQLVGEDGSSVPLQPDGRNPAMLLGEVRPEKSQAYRVHLVDAQGRENRAPPSLQIQVKENQRPKLELAFPGKDVEVSALQEMTVEGKVWDDLGVERLGAVVSVGEKTREILLSDRSLPGRTKQAWKTLFPLEELGARPADLVSYHVWAEDKGPDGGLRRTQSDLFLAEVRDWQHSFREAPPPGEEPGEEENQSQQLRAQQKEIISATWNLAQRIAQTGPAGAKEDLEVIRRSQEIVRGNASQVMEQMPDGELTRLLSQACGEMEKAAGLLGQASNEENPEWLAAALQAERAAYQYLLRAEGRETQVTRSSSSRPGAASGQNQPKRLMDLELKQDPDRYETERQARSDAQAKGEQEENLEMLRRLKELARRQEAVAERLRELEAKLEEARTQPEKEELERQLQRLREEQEELLRGVDELAERMEGQENQERLQNERSGVEQVREQVRQASEHLRREQLAEAANAARRAQEKMTELQEEFRQRTAQRFAEEMRQMRESARGLAERQEEIGRELGRAPNPQSPSERKEAVAVRQKLLDQLGNQRKSLEETLETMRQVSGQAEIPEPALAKALYEAVRRTHGEGVEESLEQAQSAVRFGAMDEAAVPERAAARALDRLKQDVEQAAESVLGSEAESLRQARTELDRLAGAVEREKAESGKRKAESGKEEEGEEQGTSSLKLPAPSSKLFFDQPEEVPAEGPLTGAGYGDWADGMRRLEDLLEKPAFRAEVSRVLDRARELRIEYRRNDQPPRWDLVHTGVIAPLLELRDRVAEELARLEKNDLLVPIDRDPVPGPYRELVRRYYEKLAREK